MKFMLGEINCGVTLLLPHQQDQQEKKKLIGGKIKRILCIYGILAFRNLLVRDRLFQLQQLSSE